MSATLTLDSFLAEDERELLILEDRCRMVSGQALRALGPAAGAKLRPDGPVETTIVAVDEAAGGYRVEKYPGCCSDLITFPAAERLWIPVVAMSRVGDPR